MRYKREATHTYRDPLEEIWLACAYKIGLRVERSDDAFVHCDGNGTLYIANDAQLDDDDSLAQMVFHELCHSLVEGPNSFALQDWGLDNSNSDDDFHEYAALLVQATLAGRYGLREVFAPTTDYREMYDQLSPDPFAMPHPPLPEFRKSARYARPAIARAATSPWWPHLPNALQDTANILQIAAKWAAPSPRPSLYRKTTTPLPIHVSGHFGRAPQLTDSCSGCAWFAADRHVCVQSETPVAAETISCERFEPPFDCQDCGACCRAAYDSVTLAPGDPIAQLHPDLVIDRGAYVEMRRASDHCIALDSRNGRFSCTVYDLRPTCCREFENAGPHCATARRRLGLSL